VVFKASAIAERGGDTDVDPVQAQREITMQKLIMTMLVAGVFAATSIQVSQAASAGGVGARSMGGSMTNENPSSGITTGMGNGGLSNEAGSISAGANSALNPSGNTFIQAPPGEAIGAERTPGAMR
jgi:hypothetical protein